MNSIRQVHPLDQFSSEAARSLQELASHGEPLGLTIQGEVALVVQDVASYQRLVTLAEKAQAMETIRLSLEDMDAGRVEPIESAFDAIRADLNLPQGS